MTREEAFYRETVRRALVERISADHYALFHTTSNQELLAFLSEKTLYEIVSVLKEINAKAEVYGRTCFLVVPTDADPDRGFRAQNAITIDASIVRLLDWLQQIEKRDLEGNDPGCISQHAEENIQEVTMLNLRGIADTLAKKCQTPDLLLLLESIQVNVGFKDISSMKPSTAPIFNLP